jgi:hypothetical protein
MIRLRPMKVFINNKQFTIQAYALLSFSGFGNADAAAAKSYTRIFNNKDEIMAKGTNKAAAKAKSAAAAAEAAALEVAAAEAAALEAAAAEVAALEAAAAEAETAENADEADDANDDTEAEADEDEAEYVPPMRVYVRENHEGRVSDEAVDVEATTDGTDEPISVDAMNAAGDADPAETALADELALAASGDDNGEAIVDTSGTVVPVDYAQLGEDTVNDATDAGKDEL